MHTILIIEDDPRISQDLEEMLQEGFHYRTLCSDNAEQARQYALDKEFCLILCDLQMKARAGSIAPKVEIGLALVNDIRRGMPGRNERPTDLLPILVMSAFAKEEHYIQRAYQVGANGFIKKPFDDNFHEVIRKALQESGRTHHDNCARLTAHARLPVAHVPAAEVPAGTVELSVSGIETGINTEVMLGGKPFMLSTALFLLLLKLVAARQKTPDAWIDKRLLGAPPLGEGWHTLPRLRQKVAKFLPKGTALVEKSGAKEYRLHPTIRLGLIDWRRLASHSDIKVSKIAKEVAVP